MSILHEVLKLPNRKFKLAAFAITRMRPKSSKELKVDYVYDFKIYSGEDFAEQSIIKFKKKLESKYLPGIAMLKSVTIETQIEDLTSASLLGRLEKETLTKASHTHFRKDKPEISKYISDYCLVNSVGITISGTIDVNYVHVRIQIGYRNSCPSILRALSKYHLP